MQFDLHVNVVPYGEKFDQYLRFFVMAIKEIKNHQAPNHHFVRSEVDAIKMRFGNVQKLTQMRVPGSHKSQTVSAKQARIPERVQAVLHGQGVRVLPA